MIVVIRIEEFTSSVNYDNFCNDFHKSRIPCEDLRLKAGVPNVNLFV